MRDREGEGEGEGTEEAEREKIEIESVYLWNLALSYTCTYIVTTWPLLSTYPYMGCVH